MYKSNSIKDKVTAAFGAIKSNKILFPHGCTKVQNNKLDVTPRCDENYRL